jgi:hypothetical protein
MSFTDTQLCQLKAPVKVQFVQEREIDGQTLHYLGGWYVIDEAIMIFWVEDHPSPNRRAFIRGPSPLRLHPLAEAVLPDGVVTASNDMTQHLP